MADKSPFNLKAGVIFPPVGSREGGARVDFRTDIPFDNQIEWHGVRLGWTRVTLCPCKGPNPQKDKEFDPRCPNCNGAGWTPFITPGYAIDPLRAGKFTPLQQSLLDKNKCMVIRGVPMSMAAQPDLYQMLGNWVFGSVAFTVRADNKLGYYDRLTYLDDVRPFSEIVTFTGGPLKLRYGAECLNGLISETKVFGQSDVTVGDDGTVSFVSGKEPKTNTRLSVNYMHHPVFVVLEYLHDIRAMPARALRPGPGDKAVDPMGQTMVLPQQVLARYEYLPLEPRE